MGGTPTPKWDTIGFDPQPNETLVRLATKHTHFGGSLSSDIYPNVGLQDTSGSSGSACSVQAFASSQEFARLLLAFGIEQLNACTPTP